MNNKVAISGKLATEPVFGHQLKDEAFYDCKVQVERLSGAFDTLPVRISERLIFEKGLHIGDTINIVGQLRSFNKIVDGNSKLILTIFVQEILDEISKQTNEIHLSGYLCKPTNYRLTPFNREIADLLIAVNRKHNKSDYIPCIAWGRNAKFVEQLKVGDKISVCGRIQSREYQKKISETETKTMTAYEVSISSLSIGELGEI